MLGAVRVHHLNCSTMCPRWAKIVTGRGGLMDAAELVGHCLLIETGSELVLVDTGFGTGDVADPARLGQPFRAIVRPQTAIEDTAIRQVEALGFDPADVRHIVVTHLDVDHAGGLGDFPEARVHVFAPELEMALSPTLRQRQRYIQPHWEHGPKWASHQVSGDEWMGFESVRPIEGAGGDIAMVPLIGHSAGHSAVAVREGDGWKLHCGDAYFNEAELDREATAPWGIRVFESLVEWNAKHRKRNLERLRDLARDRGGEVTLFCSHDAAELEREQAGSGSPGGAA